VVPLGIVGPLGAGAHDGALGSRGLPGKIVLNAVDVLATLPEVANFTLPPAFSPIKPTAVFVQGDDMDQNPAGVAIKMRKNPRTNHLILTIIYICI
jgi:hypothetical protein